MAFLKYPEAVRKLINTTNAVNAVESVHSTFEKQRIKKGDLFSL
jgi:putative transposase